MGVEREHNGEHNYGYTAMASFFRKEREKFIYETLPYMTYPHGKMIGQALTIRQILDDPDIPWMAINGIYLTRPQAEFLLFNLCETISLFSNPLIGKAIAEPLTLKDVPTMNPPTYSPALFLSKFQA